MMKTPKSFLPNPGWRILGWIFSLAAWVGLSLAALPPPPRNAVVTMVNGREFVSGGLYLTAHKDTLLLKPFGFRQFAFDGWVLSRVRYTATWPRSVKVDSLPPQVSGLEYDLRPTVSDTTDLWAPDEPLPADSLLKPVPASE
jgi:hypothetical protein